ncbi:MAG: ribosome small subunit-dependent GTPase A [Acholeplasmatales bacterium]|jgi:ribosome biogenesis GTPase|nr:ribosome small subunit-dependent GTPase A [Acholeplasmatales bacterium]
MKPGLIISFKGSLHYLLDQETGQIYPVELSGKARYLQQNLYVGDLVNFSLLNQQVQINSILPRKNKLNRPNIANIDHLIIVASAINPPFSFDLLDRFLINSSFYDLEKSLIITKIDLLTPKELEQLKESLTYYRDQLHLHIYYESSKKPQDYLADEDFLNSKNIIKCFSFPINALSGQSGVGKTTLLNKLAPEQIRKTQEVSSALQRGKNTTSHYELSKISATNTYICDTPGFLNLDINYLEADQLKNYYPDFINNTCRYGNSCTHTVEPECSVIKDQLSGKISQIRYNNYVKLYQYLKEKK